MLYFRFWLAKDGEPKMKSRIDSLECAQNIGNL